MIEFDSVTFTYPEASGPTLAGIDLAVPEGELCLVVGGTGSGKSTLLRAVNGLVPHFTGGTMSGRVVVDGRDTRTRPPRELADLVGYVGQDPAAGFVSDVVEDELAYGMESLGLPEGVMRRRVEETLDLLGLVDVRDRALSTLSTGQQQRVALGSVLTMHPRALVADEPTSALDPVAAEEVLATLQRLVQDLGLTVLLAEHRLERVIAHADRVVWLPGDANPLVVGPPETVMRDCTVAPPVVELGRFAGWSPLPLSIRDARRAAGELRRRLRERAEGEGSGIPCARDGNGVRRSATNGAAPAAVSEKRPVATVSGLVARYGQQVALAGVDLEVSAGTVTALMGRNGAGKSTLLSHFAGLRRPDAGSVEVGGDAPHALRPSEAIRRVGLVPPTAGDLLYETSVSAESRQADRDTRAEAGTSRALFTRLAGLDARADGAIGNRHPRDLSEGQRLALALAVVLAADPPLLLLDEPTRGLDYAAKARLTAILRELAGAGHAVVLATHDVELIAQVADLTAVLAEGEIVTRGSTAEVLASSPAFAPQVTKVFAPTPVLTVGEVTATPIAGSTG